MLTGLHHVTAFSGAPARNLDFYTRVLGLRLVKKTVNFDDPGTHHLYYGDEMGRPGTILTFFPIPHAASGRIGSGETQEIAFQVPRGAIGWWARRLAAEGVAHEAETEVFGAPTLRFTDPDRMRLALVGTDAADDAPAWSSDGVPADHAIRGLQGVTLLLRDPAPTAAILTGVLGLKETGREGGALRLDGTADRGTSVTLRADAAAPRGRQGAASVHHIAFRAVDDGVQRMMAAALVAEHGLAVTEQRDRHYFRSVYFREPGGVLFEIATDAPGFTVDEPVGQLGQALKLPAHLEPHRSAIERNLPPLA